MVVYLIVAISFMLFTSLAWLTISWLMPNVNASASGDAVGLTQLPAASGAAITADGTAREKFDAWFDRVVYFSGTGIGAAQLMLLAVCVALTFAGAVFLFTNNFLVSAAVALLVWVSALGVVFVMGQRRLRAFEDQLPDAMNLLSKAVRAGESLEQGVQLVGESSPEPLGVEFRRCGGQLEMGLPVATAMKSLSNRVGSFDMQVFASTVAIHRHAGGNLSQTLERLSAVIRERINYRRQMRSVTGAGRISATVISIMAPIIFLYLFFFQPQYGQRLWGDPLGKLMIVVAFVSQLLGVLWVKYILKSEY